jgi:hypothetical protein
MGVAIRKRSKLVVDCGVLGRSWQVCNVWIDASTDIVGGTWRRTSAAVVVVYIGYGGFCEKFILLAQELPFDSIPGVA